MALANSADPDAAECDVWPGYMLFVTHPVITGSQKDLFKFQDK